MKIYQPSKFEVAREIFYKIICDYATFIGVPSLILNSMSYSIFASYDTLLWFWLVTFVTMLFFIYRKFDMRRAFIIEADEQGVRLQYYYSNWFFFTEKLKDVKLKWEGIAKIENKRIWSQAPIAPICNTLYIDTKNKDHYKIEINFCSTLMKKIDKELNEMLKQYGEPKEEK